MYQSHENTDIHITGNHKIINDKLINIVIIDDYGQGNLGYIHVVGFLRKSGRYFVTQKPLLILDSKKRITIPMNRDTKSSNE